MEEVTGKNRYQTAAMKSLIHAVGLSHSNSSLARTEERKPCK